MKFKELTGDDQEYIAKLYASGKTRDGVQKDIASKYGINQRTVRKWAYKLGLNQLEDNIKKKILIYDIETSRMKVSTWWTGKQFVNHTQIYEEAKIITIAYKWLGEDNVFSLTWDKYKSDEDMIRRFMDVYNMADMIIGQNSDNFDNRWVQARAMKYGIRFNTYIKSFDIIKQTKRLFRLPSYSMAFITKFLGVEEKMQHEGMIMWEMIENGTREQHDEYLTKMLQYNVQDVIATEDMYLKLRPYMGHKIHIGKLNHAENYSCPNCGGLNVGLYKTTATAQGTIQRIMICKDDDVQFKVSNKTYMEFLDFKMI